MLLSFSRGRTIGAVARIVAGCTALAACSEWALRRVIHSWAPLEQPPYNLAFWSAHRFGTMLIVVSLTAIIASTWRRGFLELISPLERARRT
jgi:hypothetical protein